MSLSLRLLTPRGRGGIAVFELAGAERLRSLAPLLSTPAGRPLRQEDLAGRGPLRVRFALGGGCSAAGRRDELADEGLFLDRPERGVAELHLHGAPALVDELAARGWLAAPSARSAPERLLDQALDERQLALALEQCALPRPADELRALCGLPLAERRARLEALLERSRVARALAHAPRVVLFGPQNAGKSSLFNRLVLAERALTGPSAGLTRDAVRALAVLDGYPYEIVDTAGEGDSVDELDARAQAAGRALRSAAWCVLVCDGSRPPGALERRLRALAALVVCNKLDLGIAPDWSSFAAPDLALSCLAPDAGARAREALGARLRGLRGLPIAPERGVGGVAALDDGEFAALVAARSELQ
ncbi:MAG: 50S ribosome-binding GTPase [Planctomycetes bacterium]|nr:50S ribosome-binding GTPase [Planctomycetota bacterium]